MVSAVSHMLQKCPEGMCFHSLFSGNHSSRIACQLSCHSPDKSAVIPILMAFYCYHIRKEDSYDRSESRIKSSLFSNSYAMQIFSRLRLQIIHQCTAFRIGRGTCFKEIGLNQIGICIHRHPFHRFRFIFKAVIQRAKAVSYTHLDVYKRQMKRTIC